MATNQSENISLKGPEDWEAWNTQFESKAISTDIWRLIKPSEDDEEEHPEPFATKPVPPKIASYDKRLARETRSQSAQTQNSGTAQGTPVAPGEEVDYSSRPTTASEMTTAARQAFQLNWTIYQHNFKIYTAEREAIDKLRNWVLKTTSEHLIRTSCDPKDTIRGWYAKLKEQVGVSDIKLKRDAQALYKTANKPLMKAPKDAIAWLNSWEEAVTLAKEKGVPEAQHSDVWFEDFSLAIRGYMKEWIVSYKMIHAKDIEDGTLTFRKLANDLRKELLKGSTPRVGRVAKGSFGPSFADSDETDQLKSKKGDTEDKQQRTKGKGKRKRTKGESEPSTKCPACQLSGHTLANCLYVFPEKANGVFRPRENRQEEVNKRLGEDEQLRKEVD